MSEKASSFRAFWDDTPGERFVRRHDRLHRSGAGTAGRVLRMLAGVVLVLVGVVFLPLPGPGFVPILAGLALLAGESARIARALDRAEVRVRGWLGR